LAFLFFLGGPPWRLRRGRRELGRAARNLSKSSINLVVGKTNLGYVNFLRWVGFFLVPAIFIYLFIYYFGVGGNNATRVKRSKYIRKIIVI